MASQGKRRIDTRGSIQFEESSASNANGTRNRIKFGVKSYLHYFYEDCTGIGDFDAEDGYETSTKTSRRCKLFCRIGFSLSIIFICLGIVLLLLGFLIPPRSAEHYQGEKLSTNQYNTNFNEWLMYSRWVGAFTFCFGGILLSVCILLLGMGQIYSKSDSIERKMFEERLQSGHASIKPQGYSGVDEFGNLVKYGTCTMTAATSPTLTSQPVPMSLREVTPIQPTSEHR